MPRKVEQEITRFLKQQDLGACRLLVALSGGPDSLALVLALHRVRPLFDLQLTALHVDHAWREESAAEAEQLVALCSQLEIDCRVERLEAPPDSNQECVAREARIRHLKTLATEIGATAVLLGHHADDQAETVLKRLFEGASLAHSGAMRPVSSWEETVIWRPLLSLRKTELEHYVESQGYAALRDPSNRDQRYLRARLRQDILPQLTASFGKELTPGLCRHGERMQELGDYLDRRIQPWLGCLEFLDGHLTLDLRKGAPSEWVELEHLLRRCAERAGIKPRSSQLAGWVTQVQQGERLVLK